jgi:hypothetical protein
VFITGSGSFITIQKDGKGEGRFIPLFVIHVLYRDPRKSGQIFKYSNLPAGSDACDGCGVIGASRQRVVRAQRTHAVIIQAGGTTLGGATYHRHTPDKASEGFIHKYNRPQKSRRWRV